MNIYGGGRRSARRSMVPVSVRVQSCIALAFPVNMALSCTTSTLSPPYQSEIGKMTPHTRFDEVEITLEITLLTRSWPAARRARRVRAVPAAACRPQRSAQVWASWARSLKVKPLGRDVARPRKTAPSAAPASKSVQNAPRRPSGLSQTPLRVCAGARYMLLNMHGNV